MTTEKPPRAHAISISDAGGTRLAWLRYLRLLYGSILCNLLILVAHFTVSSILFGQTGGATLGGQVVDPSGGLVPAAQVTVSLPSSGLKRHPTTGESGSFSFPALAPGVYQVSVSAEGFAPVQLEDIALNVSDQKRLRIQIEVGRTTDQVTVVANALPCRKCRP